jgi:hypothetical protein
MHPSHHTHEHRKKPFTVVRKRRKRAVATKTRERREVVSASVAAIGGDKYVRDEIERREEQRLLNRHFSDTNTAAFRHLDRQERWEYVQELLRKTHVD